MSPAGRPKGGLRSAQREGHLGGDIASRRVDAGGIRLHYLRSSQGSGGSGLPLLLLHGWPEWSHAWRPVMTRLAGRFDMVAPDFRGFGRSQKTSPGPAEDATPAILAADVVALADRLGLARFGIVSHDAGSMVAQAIARPAASTCRPSCRTGRTGRTARMRSTANWRPG